LFEHTSDIFNDCLDAVICDLSIGRDSFGEVGLAEKSKSSDSFILDLLVGMLEVFNHSLEECQLGLIIELDFGTRHREDKMANTTSHDLTTFAFVKFFFFNSINDAFYTVANITTLWNCSVNIALT